MSLWLTASASAGSSRSVGTSDFERRTANSVRVGRLVRTFDPGLVEQALDRCATLDVGVEDLLEIGLLHAVVPDVLGIDHHHGTVTTLRKASGLVDADLVPESRLHRLAPQI